MNGRFPIALHIMTLLCKEDRLLSSDYIAGSINVNPVLIRKELSNMIKNKLVASQEGKNGGYRLNQPPGEITLAAIYKTVKPEAILGVTKNQPNPACPVGKQINQHLNELYNEIDHSVMQKLGKTNLLEFCDKFN